MWPSYGWGGPPGMFVSSGCYYSSWVGFDPRWASYMDWMDEERYESWREWQLSIRGRRLSRAERYDSLEGFFGRRWGRSSHHMARRLIDMEYDLGADDYGYVHFYSPPPPRETTNTSSSSRNTTNNVSINITRNSAANAVDKTANQPSIISQAQRQQFAEQFVQQLSGSSSKVGFDQAQQLQRAILSGEKDAEIWSQLQTQSSSITTQVRPQLEAPPQRLAVPAPQQQTALAVPSSQLPSQQPPSRKQLTMPSPQSYVPSQKPTPNQQPTAGSASRYGSAPNVGYQGGNPSQQTSHHTTTTTTTTTTSSLAQQYGGQALTLSNLPAYAHGQQAQQPPQQSYQISQPGQSQQVRHQQPLQIDSVQGQVATPGAQNYQQPQAMQQTRHPGRPQQNISQLEISQPGRYTQQQQSQLQIAPGPQQTVQTLTHNQLQPHMAPASQMQRYTPSHVQQTQQNPQQQPLLQLTHPGQQQDLTSSAIPTPEGQLVPTKEKKHKKHHKHHRKDHG